MTPWEHVRDVLWLFVNPDEEMGDALKSQIENREFQGWFRDTIAPMVFRHGLVGIYHEVLKKNSLHHDALTDMFNRQVMVQMNLLRLQEEVLRVLQNENISCVILKGLSLADRLYGSIGLRPSSDVDVLVSEKQRAASIAILMQNGFVEDRPIPGHFHTTLKHPDFSGAVELHHGLGDRVFPFDIPGMLGRTRNGLLDANDELLYLAYHAGRNYFVFRLVLLVDLFLAMRLWRAQIDGGVLLQRAKQARVYGLVSGALGCCMALFNGCEGKVPFNQSIPLPVLATKISKWCLQPDPFNSRVQREAWVRRALFWSCLDSWEDQIRIFVQRTLPL